MKIEAKTTEGIQEQIPAIGYAEYKNVAGAITIATTLAPKTAWQIESIRVHLSAAGGAGDLTATIDHHNGSEYDVVLLTQDMTTTVDLVWSPARPMEFHKDDKLVIAWANAGGKTYGLEIVWKRI